MVTNIYSKEHGHLFYGRELLDAIGYGSHRANINYVLKNFCPNALNCAEYGVTIEGVRKNAILLNVEEVSCILTHSRKDVTSVLQFLEGFGIEISNINRVPEELVALTTIEQLLGIKLIRQFRVVCNGDLYKIDGYDPIAKVAYEIDEPRHKYQLEEDRAREEAIKAHLGCTFKRIKV